MHQTPDFRLCSGSDVAAPPPMMSSTYQGGRRGKNVPAHSPMIRKLATLALAVAILGCGRSKLSVISVEADDPEMKAAMQTARDHFPEFWQEVSSDHARIRPAKPIAMVKAYFFDSDAPQTGEHMWVRDVQYDGKLISGFLADTPEQVKSVKTGQRVSFPLERLSDWFYVYHSKAIGAYTVKLLRTRMTEKERREHDRHYPFSFE
jgi:uncharacterized protein YegJ (DUF2314 family)